MRIKMHQARSGSQVNRITLEWRTQELADALELAGPVRRDALKTASELDSAAGRIFRAYLIASVIEDSAHSKRSPEPPPPLILPPGY